MEEIPKKSFSAKFLPKGNTQAEEIDKQITDEYIKNLSVIELVQGVLTNDKPYYAYVLIPEKKYKSFKYAEMSGNYNLANYGEILHHGEGLFPSQEVIDMMEKKYGADYNFMDKIETMGNQLVESIKNIDSTKDDDVT